MKVAILVCLVGVALCAPQTFTSSEEKFSPEPYNFAFVVEDDENTVYSNRAETQDSDGFVQGQYSWVAANGIRYTTTYTADAENGFNAVTKEEQTDIVVRLPEPYDSDERK